MRFEVLGTIFFALAILHAFSTGFLKKKTSLPHFVSEVELVFGLWAVIFLICGSLAHGWQLSLQYLESLSFAEVVFVFVILVLSSAPPVLFLAREILVWGSKLLPLRPPLAFYATTLTLGPLLGSFITEAAAMTVTALLIRDRYFGTAKTSSSFRYATLGLLFVNVSIGER